MDTFRRWLKGKGHSDLTIDAYVSSAQLFVRWYCQTHGIKADEMETWETDDVRQWRAHMLITNSSPATISRHLAGLKHYANFRGVQGLGEVPGPKRQPAAPRWLERRELDRLMDLFHKAVDTADTTGRRAQALRNRAMVAMMAYAGLRVSEVCGLQLVHLTLPQRGDGWAEIHGKGDKTRRVPLNLRVRQALRSWLDQRGYGSGLVFGILSDAVQRMVAEAAYAAHLEGVTPHTLRHTFAHELVLAGVPDRTVAELLGHADLNVTRLYTLPGETELLAAVERMD